MIFVCKSAKFSAQVLAALCMNIPSFSHGIVAGWLSPSVHLLQSANSPLKSGPMTVEQLSWTGAMLPAGACVGVILSVLISYKVGRKRVLDLIAYPQIVFWLLVIFGNTYQCLIAGRFMAGLTGGAAFASVPLFIADIAEPNIRGRIGSSLLMLYNSGVLSGYIIGACVSYHVFSYIGIAIPILYPFIAIWFPETPQTLIKRHKLDEAECSLKFYRGIGKTDELTKYFRDEFEGIKTLTLAAVEAPKPTLRDFESKDALKPIMIGIVLVFLNMFTGGFVVMTYSAKIFHDSGSTISPHISSIFVGCLQVTGCYVSTIVVDRAGRKILLIISLTGIAISHSVLGGFSYLGQHYDVTAYSWVSVVSLSCFIFMACLGILTVPLVLIAEIMPSKLRSQSVLICIAVMMACGMVVVKLFPVVVEHWKLHTALWIFAGIAICGAIFVACIVPETKGKNLTMAVAVSPGVDSK